MTASRALPIIMSAPMILGLLAGRKLQTRRTRGLEDIKRTARLVGYGKDHRGRFAADFDDPEGDGCYLVRSPYGGAGGTLYVREGVRRAGVRMGFGGTQVVDCAEYIADGAPAPIDAWGWKNKALPAIHMPYGVRRFELDLIQVRVERLHAITEAEAQAEGLEPFDGHQGGSGPLRRTWGWPESDLVFPTALEAYQAGWEWLNGAGSWEHNPWVWVLTFAPRRLH